MCSVVVWDVGGTLVDHAMSAETFLQRCLASAGVSMEALAPGAVQAAEEIRKRQEPSWRTVDDEATGNLKIATALLRSSGASDEQVRQVANAIGRYFRLYTLVPGIRPLLDELTDYGIMQGIVSNWPPSLNAFLDYHDLARYFNPVIGSGEFGAAKPDSAIFRHAVVQLGVSPNECVYIGDNLEWDVKPCRGAWNAGDPL